jgi:hypothetical protein
MEFITVHGYGFFSRFYVGIQISQDGIVLKQVRKGLGVGYVVDCHKINVGTLERSAKHITSDTTEAIDSYLYCHYQSPVIENPLSPNPAVKQTDEVIESLS